MASVVNRMTRFIVSYVNDGERYREDINADSVTTDMDGRLLFHDSADEEVAAFRLWAHWVEESHDAYESER